METHVAPPPATPRELLAETHVSTVLVEGDLAYKVKKPVVTDFLDFSSREQRRRACEREVELNRRLAPDVYLGVTELHGELFGDGEPAVVMRRMPESRRLSTLILEDAEPERHLREIARAVAAFHARARRGPDVDRAGRLERLRELWKENVGELERFSHDVLDPLLVRRVRLLAQRQLAARAPLFELRVAGQRMVDGHGDLLADDIYCLEDGPRILDCLEFDDQLRFGDTVADVAFLAMDCERLGRPDLGELFLREYREFSGDVFPDSLAHVYIAYRAVVRCKVSCLQHAIGLQGAAREAGMLLKIAARHLELARPVMVLVGGIPGSGKSTVAEALASTLGAVVVRTDAVRRELTRAEGPHREPFRAGIHSPWITDLTYTETLRRAALLIGRGDQVIIDATWSDAAQRRRAVAAAHAAGADLVQLLCTAPWMVVRHRLAERETGAEAHGSSATLPVARRMRQVFDDWPQAAHVPTDSDVTHTLGTALEVIGRSSLDGETQPWEEAQR